MKLLLIFMLIVSSQLIASNDKNNDTDRKKRIEKQIKKEIEKEKKYSKEQRFYQQHEYDLKGAEVNPDSVDSVPDIEVDDFDMDTVYD